MESGIYEVMANSPLVGTGSLYMDLKISCRMK